MATQRFNYNDKFRLNGKKVGISSASPEENLDVASGTLKGVDLQSNSGITTFSTYEGFLNKKTTYTGNVQIDTGESGTLSGEIVVGSGLTMTVGTGATSGQGDVECLKVFNVFNPPCGGTANRPAAATPGTLYYNKDFKTIEYWDGNFWRQVDNTTRSGRAVLAGGHSSPGADISTMTSVQIMTTGNAVDFGNLVVAREELSGLSNAIRGIFACGYTNSPAARKNDMDYFAIASGGNAVDFGNNTQDRNSAGAASNSTRGLVAGGYTPSHPSAPNVIDYVEIMTIGDAVDFGDISANKYGLIGCASPTRAVFAGGAAHGASAGSRNDKEIFEVSFASKGNAIEFGTLSQGRVSGGGSGNSVRGLFSGGYAPGPGATGHNTIDYITIASGGNAIDFGDRTAVGGYVTSTSTSIRSITVGERTTGGASGNVIDYVTIMTTGNATDFGDAHSDWAMGTLGDSHGGLGGF